MSTDKGCAPGKSSLIGLGSARDYDGCAILQYMAYSVTDLGMVGLCHCKLPQTTRNRGLRLGKSGPGHTHHLKCFVRVLPHTHSIFR